MGIGYQTASEIMSLTANGASCTDVLTLGRQSYFGTKKGTLQIWSKNRLTPMWIPENPYPANYIDGLFLALGCKRLDVLDLFPNENPTIQHDLNVPVPISLHNQYDIVIDGGTLEHVFNIPIALESCMRMVKPSGRLIIDTIANGYIGHGFYQFSPELFFSLLTYTNGFEVESIVLTVHSPLQRRYNCANPAAAYQRFETATHWRTSMLVIAKKVCAVGKITWPQQSDFASANTMIGGNKPWEYHKPSRLEFILVEYFPRLAERLKALKFSPLRKELSIRNTNAFKKL